MSDNGSTPQPDRPLTRREIRERERAAMAERAEREARAAEQDARAARPSGDAAPPVTPPSRRALRQSTPSADPPTQPAVVRPPAATGGIRRLDDTGRLTPVEETAEQAAVQPPAQPSSGSRAAVAPVRTSARPPAGSGTSGSSSSVPPAAQPAPARDHAPASTPFAPVRGENPRAAAETPFAPVNPDAPTGSARDERAGGEEAPAGGRNRGPSYTWLHYLVLVGVAFVLGLLVWQLVSRDAADAEQGGAQAATWSVAAGTTGTVGTMGTVGTVDDAVRGATADGGSEDQGTGR